MSDSRKKKKSGKKSKKKENQARNSRKKNQTRISRKKESGKNSRTQESWLAKNFLPRQPRFGLHGSCQKGKISFFRQESCTEGMEKESWLQTKKNKNLERMMARSSTCVSAHH